MNDDMKWIAEATPYQLLRRWRFAPLGDPIFAGEAGKAFAIRIGELRKDQEHWAALSKKVGWNDDPS